MIPFYTRFPEIAARETRSVHVVAPGGPLPLGEYSYIELYCDELGCDCRRVVLEVVTPKEPYNPLAVINFGWESAEFYSRKLFGDARAGREITRASLDPINPQSKNADFFLDLFQKEIMTDPAYVARLARHYEMFKQDLRDRPHLDAVAAPKVGRNDPCPCGSGKKFKKCCGK
jgi:hypothetical protein